MQAAREQGINPRAVPALQPLVNQAMAQTDQSIQQTLGDAAFQQYQQYQQTLPERNVVNNLQQSLGYTQTPLTDDEAASSSRPSPSTSPSVRATDGRHQQRRRRRPRNLCLMNGGAPRASPMTPSARPRESSRRTY